MTPGCPRKLLLPLRNLPPEVCLARLWPPPFFVGSNSLLRTCLHSFSPVRADNEASAPPRAPIPPRVAPPIPEATTSTESTTRSDESAFTTPEKQVSQNKETIEKKGPIPGNPLNRSVILASVKAWLLLTLMPTNLP